MDTNKKQIIWSYLPVTFITALFCCVLWGSASPAIKIAYEIFKIPADDTASRLMLAGARFLIAGGMTVIFGSVISRKILLPEIGSLKYIMILSMLQTVGQYFFFFMALANISGVRGSIINASGNFLAIIIAVYIFRLEKLTMRKFIGCLIGFSGIVIILGGIKALLSGGAVSFQGEGAMLMAALFYAFSSCCIKIFSKYENPVILSGYQFVLGGFFLYIIGMIMGGQLVFWSASCYMNLIYMGFISAGAYTLWGVLLKHNPVSRVSVFGFMNPVMGVVLSALFLGENTEAFSFSGLASLLLVALGIVIVNYSGPVTKEKKEPEESTGKG